ncbi:N-acetylmuramoyl-L-alanine amidase [Palleronia salina]|uniref:N-acetylmuramoyl-L-alanine amidase n=1 Tax=Palleronia salina TaxID=313368 RepID=A0A1M6BK44_9RHOB|nr:N-acetylmuramoyl-L-alanine amidase [Palleronia salina]SHI49095.1 N-acetylmuramoyl-L-alanine amidase [Palleronia salina]
MVIARAFRTVVALGAFTFAIGAAVPAASSEPAQLTALARIDTETSRIADFGSDLQIELALSQPVPWRVFTLSDPRRLVVDFGEVDFTGSDLAGIVASDGIEDLGHGRMRDGWSRLVVTLAEPMAIETAGLVITESTGRAVLKLSLAPSTDKAFAAAAGAPESGLFALPEPAAMDAPLTRQTGDRPLRVVLDPGHGGIDPGAMSEGLTEADVILGIAHELGDALRAAGHEVTLTREDDSFVSLERRVSIARAARADLFMSLHADALTEGRASGASVYTLSDRASDVASQKLAERHDRSDLLAGLDLHSHDDEVALVLMDLARRDTAPRSDRLAARLVDGLASYTGDLHKRPRLQAGFSVLKAPDIPSVLVELGFLSSARDRANLTDPEWRAQAVAGIVHAVDAWAAEDAVEARGLRQ